MFPLRSPFGCARQRTAEGWERRRSEALQVRRPPQILTGGSRQTLWVGPDMLGRPRHAGQARYAKRAVGNLSLVMREVVQLGGSPTIRALLSSRKASPESRTCSRGGRRRRRGGVLGPQLALQPGIFRKSSLVLFSMTSGSRLGGAAARWRRPLAINREMVKTVSSHLHRMFFQCPMCGGRFAGYRTHPPRPPSMKESKTHVRRGKTDKIGT